MAPPPPLTADQLAKIQIIPPDKVPDAINAALTPVMSGAGANASSDVKRDMMTVIAAVQAYERRLNEAANKAREAGFDTEGAIENARQPAEARDGGKPIGDSRLGLVLRSVAARGDIRIDRISQDDMRTLGETVGAAPGKGGEQTAPGMGDKVALTAALGMLANRQRGQSN